MKSSLAVIACLLYGTQAIQFQIEQKSIGERMRDIDEKQFVSIGEKIKSRELQMIQDTNYDHDGHLSPQEQSNSDVARQLFGQVDFDTYNEETKTILNRTEINIKFENQSGMPEKIVYEKKKVAAPIQVAQKVVKEEEFTEDQKKGHQDFLEDKISEYEVENSVNLDGEETQRSSQGYAQAMVNKELDQIKSKEKAENNLHKLKNKKKHAVQKLQQLEVKSKVSNTKNEKLLDAQWDKFCLNFKKADYDKANQMWAKFNKEGAEFEPLQVRTKELYQKAFIYESVAQNESVQAQIEELNIAQSNLNNNLKNPDLMVKFIKTAQKTKKNLKQGAFGSFWTEPTAE